MELTIQQGDLAFAVGKAFGSVSAKSPMPLLSCLLVEADKQGLRVTGGDLDVTTAVTVPCAVKAVGKVAVSARHFNEVVRKIPRGPLQFTIAGEQCELRYGDGKGWSRFPIQDASDFPRVPELKAENQASLAGDALARLITRSLYAASTDATRPNLIGVFIQGGDKQVTCVTTDAREAVPPLDGLHRLRAAAADCADDQPRPLPADHRDGDAASRRSAPEASAWASRAPA